MKWLVSGTRRGRKDVPQWLDKLMRELGKPDLLICGECRGVDRQAEAWAKLNGVRVEVLEAHWDLHGKAAGPDRNARMVAACGPEDWVLCFPDHDSRGTRDCYWKARRALLRAIELPVNPLATGIP